MKLISRNQVFEKQNNLAKLIRRFQKDCFDEEYDNLENETFDILIFDLQEIEYESFIIEVNHKDLETYTKIISKKLIKLLEVLNSKELTLISHLKLDFFEGIEYLEDVRILENYSKLSKIINLKKYNEAITIELSEVETFFEIFFWMNIGNQISEFIFWSDLENKYCFNICKYGKLHFIDFTNGNLISNKDLKILGFNKIKTKCSDGIMLK